MLLHPAIAESGFASLGSARACPSADADPADSAALCPDLLKRFGAVTDGRADQGRVHPVAVVLALCAAGVVAGMRSFTAIAGWAADVPGEVLAALYGQASSPPSKATIWRVVTGADAVLVDAVIGAWLAEQAGLADPAPTGDESVAAEADSATAIAVDGKTVRGATDEQGNQLHLLAAATHREGLVIGQVAVGAKTNEIPMFAPLLKRVRQAGIALSDVIITADALHTQRGHVDYLHEAGAGFCFTVKENQPGLFAALDGLPWSDTPIAARDVDTGHGRITTRTIRVLPAPADLPFPHIRQVWLIERYITEVDGTPVSAAAALGVTNLDAATTPAERLAALIRRHWGIESLHWLRDTVYREDHSTVHTRSGPHVMAALRNLAVGTIRLAGRYDITEATRWAARSMIRPFTLLKLA